MLSSSLSISAGSLLLALLASPVAAAAENYQLVENWHGESFLDYFNFHTGSDPTNGFVTYLDQTSAESAGLVKVNDGGKTWWANNILRGGQMLVGPLGPEITISGASRSPGMGGRLPSSVFSHCDDSAADRKGGLANPRCTIRRSAPIRGSSPDRP